MRWLQFLALTFAPLGVRAAETETPAQARSVGAQVRLGFLQGEPRELASDASFGFGIQSSWFYRPNVGLRLEATFDRFGGLRDTHQQISYFSFAALPLMAAMPLARWLPWAALGGGLSIGWFRSNAEEVAQPGICELDPELPAGTCPARARAALPFARAVGGVSYDVASHVRVGALVEYTLIVSDETVAFTQGTETRNVLIFDDTIAVAVSVDYQF